MLEYTGEGGLAEGGGRQPEGLPGLAHLPRSLHSHAGGYCEKCPAVLVPAHHSLPGELPRT